MYLIFQEKPNGSQGTMNCPVPCDMLNIFGCVFEFPLNTRKKHAYDELSITMCVFKFPPNTKGKPANHKLSCTMKYV